MPPKGKSKEDKAAIKQLKDALYARCAQEDPEKRFSTEDLLELGVIRRNDHEMLMQCTQVLLAEGLFQVSSTLDGALFQVIRKEDAARYVM